MKQKKKPTVLNNEEYSSKYILFNILNILDNKIFNDVIIKSMNLVQEVLFMYSRKETTAKPHFIANIHFILKHYAFSLKKDYAIIEVGSTYQILRGLDNDSRPENLIKIFYKKVA